MQIETNIIDALEFSLTDYERDMCEGLFTLDELFAALKGLQTSKAPGSDGLSTEFYLCFWSKSFHAGSLAKSQYEGLLRLIHKKDDRRLPKNWRLISLLNTDYKLRSFKSYHRTLKESNELHRAPGSDQWRGGAFYFL